MTAMVWLRALGLPQPVAATSSLENTRDKIKIEFCSCTCQPVVNEPKRMRKKVRLCSLGGGG